MAVRWQPAEPVTILSDETRHRFAIQLLRDAMPTQPIVVRPITPAAATESAPIILLADVDELEATLRRSLALPDRSVLGPGGYLARASDGAGGAPVVAIGGDPSGVIYAAREVVDRQLRAGPEGVEVPSFAVERHPALPYRLFWTWDHSTNWYLNQLGLQEVGASNVYYKPPTGFLEDYHRVIDFMSQHRLNGLVIYGFLRDRHGGVEAAQEIARYGKERGVRVLPGVGINAYGGIYWEGAHRYNLAVWLREHPELRAHLEVELPAHLSYFREVACPSKEANRVFHREAIRWLCEEFDIGGINFETGDYAICQCPECKARRTDEGKWSLADIAELYPPLFDEVRQVKPDAWLVAEAYFDNVLDPATISPLAQLPPDTICQYCINRGYWPRVQAELTAEHVARLPLRRNVLRTHMGSQFNHERYHPAARTFADLARQATVTGLQGVDMFGEVSPVSTVNELNYLAYATFAYDREISWDVFVADVLGPRLGGAEAAGEYLRLLETAADAAALDQAAGQAREIAAPLTDTEQHRRWTWLMNRLYQARAMGAT